VVTLVKCGRPDEWEAAEALIAEYFLSFQNAVAARLTDGDRARLTQIMRVFSQPRAALFLAVEQDDPVGCCGLCPRDEATAELKRLYVRPAVRHGGVGIQLLDAVTEHGRGLNYDRLVLDVLPDRQAAISLYERRCWKRIPHWEGRHDMLAFELPLGDT